MNTHFDANAGRPIPRPHTLPGGIQNPSNETLAAAGIVPLAAEVPVEAEYVRQYGRWVVECGLARREYTDVAEADIAEAAAQARAERVALLAPMASDLRALLRAYFPDRPAPEADPDLTTEAVAARLKAALAQAQAAGNGVACGTIAAHAQILQRLTDALLAAWGCGHVAELPWAEIERSQP
jgi:hypothetical protein